MLTLKNVFSRNKNIFSESKNNGNSDSDADSPAGAPQLKEFGLANSNAGDSSFHSAIRPSNNSQDFVVLSPFYKQYGSQGSDGLESPGKLALRQGIKKFNEKKFESAKHLYEVAVAHGEIYAMHNLATMLLHGQGIPKNVNLAKEYFVRCAESGISLSMSQLGYIYLYGKGVKVDYKKAKEWFYRASQTGNEAYAQYCLSAIYICGYGVAIDVQYGLSWLFKSAQNNFIPAIYNLAVLYEHGEMGLSPNYRFAVQYYQKSGIKGHDEFSQNNLAVMYFRSGHNLKDAVKLLHLAESKGLSQAMFNLGEAYANGIGVPKDVIKSAQYYYRAAKADINSDAEYALADLFLYGFQHKIRPNIRVARYWLERAANNGHAAARMNLRIVKNQFKDKT